MKQKLAIARTLLHRPPVIFLDEPTAGLDPEAAASLREDIAGIAAREGATIFINTHNLAEAEKLCAKVGVIKQGKLLATGSPNDLRHRTGVAEVTFVGAGFTPALRDALLKHAEVASVDAAAGRLTVRLRGESPVAAIVRDVVGAGCDVEEVTRGQSSLEDVFLSLVREEST